MKIRMNVATYDEWFDNSIDAVEVELSPCDIMQINHLSKVCTEHGIYKVSLFHNPLDLLCVDWESEDEGFKEYDGRVECVTLNVTTTDFFWSGYYKHTNIRWETDSIPVKSLDSGEEFIDLWEGN